MFFRVANASAAYQDRSTLALLVKLKQNPQTILNLSAQINETARLRFTHEL